MSERRTTIKPTSDGGLAVIQVWEHDGQLVSASIRLTQQQTLDLLKELVSSLQVRA
jgi:hypothetical protein